MASYFLDCSNQLCPAPILMTEERMKSLKEGDTLEVLYTDPGATEDLKAWCRMMGYDLSGFKKEKKSMWVDILKKEAHEKRI